MVETQTTDTLEIVSVSVTNLNYNTMKITSITPKNQSMVNKAVNWLIKYNEFNTQRDFISDNLECEEYESKEWKSINRKCENSFDKYLDYMSELPKREQAQIEKSELY
tara:strand:+ start:250 stop:573 length:324 start_codon:yes stop_codon:yes gene_type:complete